MSWLLVFRVDRQREVRYALSGYCQNPLFDARDLCSSSDNSAGSERTHWWLLNPTVFMCSVEKCMIAAFTI